MADKAISELIAASQVTPTDLFVLEQSGTAKKLTGQTLENWLLSIADGHGGIQSIAKVGTNFLEDTYRITLADTTTFDFVVTNGKAISSVEQTSNNGLTRTYTIAFNDGTSQTFTVTDGRGITSITQTAENGLSRTYTISMNDGTSETFTITDGRSITDIEKTATNLLTDTYTISFNDGSSSTFTVKNGKGIQSFAKVSTDGLVDTYRIEYNDETSDEFTVTNGAKGDKGENTFTHIKFASQEPTEESHSFGDIPDDWIGFYWGNSSDAPTDWTQYAWFMIKGERGDIGAAATLTSSSVEYRVGDSGSIIPSGAWSDSVPVVPQGKYLWTRTTNTFNTGTPVVSYSVARMGLDGSGSVSSVANISPDGNGNVPLTANDVGALPSTGGDMIGSINMNGQPINGLNPPTDDNQAANKGYVDQTRSIAQGGTGATTAEDALQNLHGCKIEVVWENADTSSAFGAQQIEVEGIADYDLFLFEFMNGTTSAVRSFTFVRKGYNSAAVVMANLNSESNKLLFSSRVCKVNDSEYITFNDCYSRFADEAATKNNDRVIPVRVFGIKGVITT